MKSIKIAAVILTGLFMSSAYADVYCTQTEEENQEVYFDYFSDDETYELLLDDLDYWGDAQLFDVGGQRIQILFTSGKLEASLVDPGMYLGRLSFKNRRYSMICYTDG